jgi:NHS family xanthosine MFS transporter
MMMTNGLGATIGTVLAQQVVNLFVDFTSEVPQIEGWSKAWFVFAGYMLVVTVLFAFLFKYKHNPSEMKR